MTPPPTQALVVIDLSNLCRDSALLPAGRRADLTILDRFVEALGNSAVGFRSIYCVADRSLPPLLDSAGKRRLRELEADGRLEFSTIADERLLELAFGNGADPATLIASHDNFDDFRRTYPSIQGSVDRFIGWEVVGGDRMQLHLRDMGVHEHQRLSRKEEGAELKARRLRRQSIVREAARTYFRCNNGDCLLAQLWSDRLPELPRYDDQAGQFVCPSCFSSLDAGEPRPASTQLIVFLNGVEQCRILLDEGQRLEVGRRDTKGCVGLESRLDEEAAAAVSRRHLAFQRSSGHVRVEDLGSRNGTVLRRTDGTAPDQVLVAGHPTTIGRRSSIALPSGITIEVSGRSIPLDGERPPDTGADEADDRSTRILATRR